MVDTEMAGGAGPGPSEPPAASRTLYIHNLYERARKEELRKCLHAVFCQFGTVSQIHVSKTYKLRGQAWVVFDSVQAAEEAKTLMNGFPLYEKPLRIEFAKTKSDAVAKEDGSFVPRPAYDKKQRMTEVKMEIARKRRAKEAAAATAPPTIASAPAPRAVPTIASAPAPQAPSRPMGLVAIGGMLDAPALPHKVLFVQGLPHSVDQAVLRALFAQFPQFKEVRTVEARPGIAFIEYEHEAAAGAAMAGLQGFSLDGESISITYGKR